jgi:phospholipase C
LSKAQLIRTLREVPAAGVSTLFLALLLTGCGEYHVFGADAAPTVAIAAKPASIAAGASSSLTVTASNAAQITVTGSDGEKYSVESGGGTLAVSPSATTTYTAVAAGAGGSASAKATVTVTESHPPTVTITADPPSIIAGSTSMLTVKAANATQVTISGSNGAHFTLKPDGGKQEIDPISTTTYTAVATGPGGKASANLTVDVTSSHATSVTIAAAPDSITPGDSSILTVTARNATQVIVTGTNGRKFVLPGDGGKETVHPSSTTTFTAVATGPDGKASAKTVVTVKSVSKIPVPTVSIRALPVAITAGSSSILTISATDADQVTLTGTNGTKYDLPKTGGKEAVSPAVTTTYTAVATAVDGKKASANITIKVTPSPAPTVAITADPASITSGSSSTLVVNAAHATKVTITGPDGVTYTLKASGGRQLVSPTTTSKYTASATGPGGTAVESATVTVTPNPAPSVTITANPTTVVSGNSSTLKVIAANATQVMVTGTDGSSYSLAADGGTQLVSPTETTTYTAVATGPHGKASESATVTVTPPGNVESIDHVIFMLQENHTFDDYLGMLNPYRKEYKMNVGDDGVDYEVDGIDDKLNTTNPTDSGANIQLFKFKSTCIDDDSSDWLASAGDINRWDFTTSRAIDMNGFVHTAAGYANYCATDNTCSGKFTDTTGVRAMGYYDQGFLNYYYYMASQFALSDRWFSPVASKSIDNRIATFTGGTTQGLTRDPGNDDHLPQLDIPNIFQELDEANVSWKIYYTVTQGFCLDQDDCPDTAHDRYPATDFSSLSYSLRYLSEMPASGQCTPPTQPSSVVGDSTNSFCIDTDHIAPLSTYFSDLTDGTLPSFAFIEAGYGRNDEHPGSEQPVLDGQAEVAHVVDSFMASTAWKDSVFFLSYDEGGGPYDHVPPVPGHSNDFTDASLGTIPDISSIAVNPDSYYPCLPGGSSPYCNCPPGDTSPTTHCDLLSDYPGATAGDAAYEQGFAAQLGFRLPNMVISPFTRRHYVSHIPMDHTAVIKFVEDRFIPGDPHLTARDAAQPNLLDFFDFNNDPWEEPPTPPAPYSDPPGTNSCTPTDMGP